MITQADYIPYELKRLKQWVCWIGADKVPRNPYTGGNAMSNNPDTWGYFDEAAEACDRYHFDGVGFMFANGYFGVDLDKCIDDFDFCDEFVDTLGSYAELSKSGNGIHIICKGELPPGGRRHGRVEMYSSGRYFICTGKIYNPKYSKVIDCTESIKPLHAKYIPSHSVHEQAPVAVVADLDDQEIIDKARNSKTGYVFNMLYQGNWQGVYGSQSEADLALCNQLAFWTQRNELQMDRIFRTSGLMRKKWDEKRSGSTYGAITINKACAGCTVVYEPNRYDDDTSLAMALFKERKDKDEDQKKIYDMTDTGNAHRLQDKFGSMIRYSYNRRKWFWWTGKVWSSDDSGEVKKMADVICDDIKLDAFMEQDEKTQADMLKWANKTASSKGKESMIKECQHLPGIPVFQDDLDPYIDYMNCKNGIINLNTGELMPHESSFMMTKMCDCEYDTSGKKPKRWMKFLDEVTNGNKELQEYIQRSVGYSLTGSNAEQCAYFLYGMGNNGKSTFLDTISDILGGYSSNAQPDTIMMKKWGGDSANSDIARLKGARFVTSEEPTEGVRLNEGLLKQLTGGSKVTCRFLYGDEFEYTPEFKIWIATNHKPIVRGTDYGIWRRIKLIPFEVNIPKAKIDKDLKLKLKAEAPQILRWAVEGCMKWRKEGMTEPQCVLDAVQEYKQEMDILAGFIEQCVEIDYDCKDKLTGGDLFRAYSKWAKENNEYEMSSKKFFVEIGKKLPEKGRNSSGVFFKYVKLIPQQQERQYKISDFVG